MKRTLAAVLFLGVISSAGAQEASSETYFGVLGNFLVSSDSSRELDGFGVQALYGVKPSSGWPIEYRAFYDRLESRNSLKFFRTGAGADLILGLADFGVPEFGGIRPFVLGGGGVVYGDAVPGAEAEFDVFANLGVGAMSMPLTASGWRIRGDLKYVYENLGDGYLDLHAALGLEIPLGEMVAAAAEPVRVVRAAAPADTDDDNDGVSDRRDRCPGTRAGTVVQDDGCAPPPVVDRSSEPTEVLVLKGVSFENNSDQLREESVGALDEAVESLKGKYSDAHVEVAGHSDSLGDDAYNLDLSRRRAQSVRQYLIQGGVDGKRLSAEGYGETQPVADNGTREGRSKNRRVELRVRD